MRIPPRRPSRSRSASRRTSTRSPDANAKRSSTRAMPDTDTWASSPSRLRPARRARSGRATSGATTAPRDAMRGVVASPAVGYFAPRSGVDVGAKVRSGDPLGYVDVLGVRQEVVSPIDGALRSFEVESGQAVEYGQALARVE